jgi:hypothetical protein
MERASTPQDTVYRQRCTLILAFHLIRDAAAKLGFVSCVCRHGRLGGRLSFGFRQGSGGAGWCINGVQYETKIRMWAFVRFGLVALNVTDLRRVWLR